MNSDTLDLGGERREPTRRERCRGHRCGRRVPLTDGMQGEGDCAATAAHSLSELRVVHVGTRRDDE
jgi:hypothetical protein